MKFFRYLILLLFSGPVISAPYFVQCYDFRCKSNQEIRFSDSQWGQIRTIFNTQVLDLDHEKQAIRVAIAAMERFSGEISGTYLDKGGNYPGYDIARQMDCIDESTNTFSIFQRCSNWTCSSGTGLNPSKDAWSGLLPTGPRSYPNRSRDAALWLTPGTRTMVRCRSFSRLTTGSVNAISRSPIIRNWLTSKLRDAPSRL